MNTRRAGFDLKYNGRTVTTKLAPYSTEISYTDPATDSADSLDISIHDRNRQWTGAWIPVVGDTLEATIWVNHWEAEGDYRSLPCGFFILDNFSFSGWPIRGSLSAVSTPADSSFKATTRTKNWENVTLEEIGKEIAARAGISLIWDVEGEPFIIQNVEQSEQTDCEFYAQLCKSYGLNVKVYSQKIVVYERVTYKQRSAVMTIGEGDLISWSWSKNLQETYTGGEYTYTDPTTEEELKVVLGSGTRILKQSGKADDRADAERKLRAALDEANHGAVKMSVTIMGNASLVAAQNVEIVGMGQMSGKYYIDSITHRLSGSGGYTMDLELSLIYEIAESSLNDATNRLSAVGVMDTPDYWITHSSDIQELNDLILNLAARIKINQGGTSISTADAALKVLEENGVISTAADWSGKVGSLNWLDTLLIKAANAMTTA